VRLRFWRKNLNLVDIALDDDERESLFRLLHAMDGIKLQRRVEDPIERSQDSSRTVRHFYKRGVVLPWDVDVIKEQLTAYEQLQEQKRLQGAA